MLTSLEPHPQTPSPFTERGLQKKKKSSKRSFITFRAQATTAVDIKRITKRWGAIRKTPTYLYQAVTLFEALRMGDGAAFWAAVLEYLPGKVVSEIMGNAPNLPHPPAPSPLTERGSQAIQTGAHIGAPLQQAQSEPVGGIGGLAESLTSLFGGIEF